MLRKFLLASLFLFLGATLANAQVVAEDSKLGATPGLHLKAGVERESGEVGGKAVEKNIFVIDVGYTLNSTYLIGLQATTSTTKLEGATSETGNSVAAFGKILWWRNSWRGGLLEFSSSAETVLQSTTPSVSSLLTNQLRVGAPVGSTKVTLTLYGAHGPLSTLLGAQFRLNTSENGIKLGDAVVLTYGYNRYLLPYAKSKKQLIAGVEIHGEGRMSSSQSGLAIQGTGGWDVMVSPTLRLVLSSQLTISAAVTLPVVERYGAAELTSKRNVKVGVTYAF